jgi:hypothetical protein
MLLRLFLQRYFMHKLLKGFGIFFIVLVLTSMTFPTKSTVSLSNKSTIDNCDVIYFINGERVEATNIVIDGEFVRYKSCDNTYSLTYYGSTIMALSNRVSTHKHQYILYKNGSSKRYTTVYKIFNDFG